MDKESIRQTVRDYILREFLQDEPDAILNDDTPLITGGVLDSISTIKLVSFLEENFKVEFAAHEVSPEYLDSLQAIGDTIADKLG
ncbi:MAG: acyl carrier protein [Planctomycetota bacterium]